MAQELSPLQKEYAAFFFGMLQKYEVETPAKLTDEKRSEFFNEIKKEWKKKKKELAKQGIKGVNESFSKNELIKSQLQERTLIKSIIKEILLQEATDEKQKVIDRLIKLGNNKSDVIKMVNKEWDYVNKTYPKSTVAKKAEIIRSIA